MIYDFLAWYFRRRWMVKRIIEKQTKTNNDRLLSNMLECGMLKAGTAQYNDFIDMMQKVSK